MNIILSVTVPSVFLSSFLLFVSQAVARESTSIQFRADSGIRFLSQCGTVDFRPEKEMFSRAIEPSRLHIYTSHSDSLFISKSKRTTNKPGFAVKLL